MMQTSGRVNETLTVIPEKVQKRNNLFDSNVKSSMRGDDFNQVLNQSQSAKILTNPICQQDPSGYLTSKLNILDDLLLETFARKQSMTQTNIGCMDRYLDTF